MERRRDAEALHVEIVAHLHCVARLPHVGVIIFRRFHQQRIFPLGVAHTLNAVRVVVGEHIGMGVHVLPHAIVDWQ